jgi:hypothetical protein
MSRIDALAKKFEDHISLPWQKNLSSEERTIFLVYPKDEELRLRAKRDLFRQATESADHQWEELHLDKVFPDWMASQEYAADYYDYPQDIEQKLEKEFCSHISEAIINKLKATGENGVVAIFGVGTLFGLCRLSLALKSLNGFVNGRLVIFFPGSYDRQTYRLLDARDGWGYMAYPITLNEVSHL